MEREKAGVTILISDKINLKTKVTAQPVCLSDWASTYEPGGHGSIPI